jgi:hypothetical protein
MSKALRVAFALLLGFAFTTVPASGKRGAKTSKTASVTIMASSSEAASMAIAADLADVLDDAEDLRVLPVVGRGPIQSLTDLIYLKGIDAAVIPADALAYAERHDLLGKTAKKVRYVAKLGSSDVHVVARAGIASLSDLNGKKVDVGLTGEERFAGANLLFDTLGIRIEEAAGPESRALERLKKGEIDAAILYGRKPLPALAGLTKKDGLTLLAIPPHSGFEGVYAPQIFDGKDYPGLIGGKDMVEGLSVGTVLAVFDWPVGSQGFDKLKTLTSGLFAGTDMLQEGDRRAAWGDINLAASVPGWTRYSPSEQWLKGSAPVVAEPEQTQEELKGEFTAFVAESGTASNSGEEALFARFLEWQKKRDGE